MAEVAEKETLTEKADRVYRFIYHFLKENAKSPSHREICDALEISTETLAKCLNLLEEQGRNIKRVRGRGRQIWVPINQQPEED